VTHLRKLMLEELQRRNYAQTTVTGYLKTVTDFAKYFQRPPDQLGPDEIRTYQLYLLNERKQGARTVGTHTAALRFFFCKTLKRTYPVEEIPYPRAPRRLPIILTQEEAHSNSTLIVEFADRLRASGKDSRTAIAEASSIRLRPILMTAAAALLALLPAAFDAGDPASSLARAVIGGLTSSTLLILFVLPPLYVEFKK